MMVEQTSQLSIESGTIFDENGNPIAEYDKDARTWGMFCHLSGALVILGVPLVHILGPLVIWLWKGKEYPFVKDQGKEALNFQISMALYGLVGWLLTLVFIGWMILALLVIVNLVLIAMAAMNANKGEVYRYPLNLRLIK